MARYGQFFTARALIIAVLAFLALPASALAAIAPASGVIVQDEGVDKGRARTLNFTGAGVTASQSGGTATIDITSSQTPWTSNINAAGFTLFGNSTSGGNLTLDSTSHATKGYTILNPTGGRVGIGTTTPGAFFDAKTATNRHVVIRDQSAGSQILGAIDGVADYATLLIDGTTVQFQTTSGGLVGIGGVPSAAKLEVFGDALTGSASAGILSFSQTWNTTGAPVAVRFTITDTASHANSKAWQILGGASGTTNLLEVSKAGVVTAPSFVGDFTGSATLPEIVAPGTCAANKACLYAEDNGSGKTRLMVQFASGTPMQIAVEP